MLRKLNHAIIALVPKSEHCSSVTDYGRFLVATWSTKPSQKLLQTGLPLHWSISSTIAKPPFLEAETLPIIFSWRMKWFDSTRENGFHLVVPLMSTYARHSIQFHRDSSPKSYTALNGSLYGFFSGKRGLRQGDPMSPALFLLCMEFFSRTVKRNTANSEFNFHPKCEKLKITHLLFADDLMLFSRGDLPSVHILMECLQEFRDVLGLAVNTSKSSIFTTDIVDNVLDGILARTEFTRGEMPVRYLGIPLAAQRLSVTDYSLLVDRIAHCISKWSAKSLSFAGRLELIHSVIQWVECFWL
ncbi:UNVERIFIED_CONTAM: putative mitochondrial protein [Sesamum radiatum]|uniref:Mitochondrial protein n=1 Tax=Sesamum radiatum TaxID=300843 RepID=A0AAW2TXB4_SESRA